MSKFIVLKFYNMVVFVGIISCVIRERLISLVVLQEVSLSAIKFACESSRFELLNHSPSSALLRAISILIGPSTSSSMSLRLLQNEYEIKFKWNVCALFRIREIEFYECLICLQCLCNGLSSFISDFISCYVCETT